MTRDAEMSTQDYVTPGARRRRPRDRQLGRAHPAAAGRDGRHPVRRPERRREPPAAARRRPARGCCAAAVPGSDSQLQFARAFASAPRPPTSSSRSSGPCWTATELLDGLTIDTDLRWHLLHQLVAAGKADEREVDRELDADDTATGRRQAAAALAARPDGRGEGRGVVVGGRRRRAAERDPDRDDRRLLPGRPAGPAAALTWRRTSTPSRRCGRSGPTRPRRTS